MPLCPYCGKQDLMYLTSGKCGNKVNDYNPDRWRAPNEPPEHIPDWWKAPSQRKTPAPKDTSTDKREMDEVSSRIKGLLSEFLSEQELSRAYFTRSNEGSIVFHLPADLLLKAFDKNAELIEELRQIIDGLS